MKSCINQEIYTGSLENLIDFDMSKSEFIGEGSYGCVYKYGDDSVIKLLSVPGSSEQYDMMSTIKNLSLPNFYKLHDILFYKKDDIRTFGGTISKYYSKDDVDIFLQPSDYLLDSFNSLCTSMKILGENQIAVYDFHKGNIILNKDGIIVIDTDLYQKMDNIFSKRISSRNLFKLKSSIFYELLLSNFLCFHGSEVKSLENINVSNILYNLMNLDNLHDTEVLNKTLSKYKYPIDYMIGKMK